MGHRFRRSQRPYSPTSRISASINASALSANRLSFGRRQRRSAVAAGDHRTKTAGNVQADSAYRGAKNEALLNSNMLKNRIHRHKPKGKPMPENMACANASKSAIRAKVEHVFAHRKNRYGRFIRTIGLARAQAKFTLAKLGYNFDR